MGLLELEFGPLSAAQLASPNEGQQQQSERQLRLRGALVGDAVTIHGGLTRGRRQVLGTVGADHGEVGDPIPADGGDSETVLAKFADAGIDVAALAAQLQRDGAASFVSSWKDLMTRIEKQRAALS